MKKPVTQRIGDFFAGRGFYIVLFLCIAAIGISGYYLISVLASPGGDDPLAVVDPVTDVVVPTQTLSPPPVPTVTATPEPTVTLPAETPAPSPTTASNGTDTVTVFTWPVKGEAQAGFSLQALCYDETMGDWRTHSGMDIAASEGTNVLAMADGVVASVTDDPWMGSTVKITHAGGLESVYSNLSDSVTVSEGDEVDCGQVIGVVGQTALAEAGASSHLPLLVWL